MFKSPQYQAAYIAFDPYPSFKGSATHIAEVYQTMQESFGKCLLITLKGEKSEESDHIPILSSSGNYLERGVAFSKEVKKIIQQNEHIETIQFRDIWGGTAILHRQDISCIFEANGFPSIELKERYSILSDRTIEKIWKMEDSCLRKASKVICPSEVIAKHVSSRGISNNKISVIPNGAHIADKLPVLKDLPSNYLIYFGALQPWQGVNNVIKAMNYLTDITDLQLVICSSHKEKLAKPLKKMISNLGLTNKITWFFQQDRNLLRSIIHQARISVVPLSECERNIVQGCSPLKIYESMACKTAVIASDLPVTREIIDNDREGILIKPDRPAELARQIRLLLENPDKENELVENAYNKIKNSKTWKHSNLQLNKEYKKLLKNVSYEY